MKRIEPEWPAPGRVHAFVTTREGGVSTGEFASLNLGERSGDAPENVARNRAIVRGHLPAEPRWLEQVHGAHVVELGGAHDARLRADAAVTGRAGEVAVVLAADCMPLFLANRDGSRVGLAHAGWRGMAAGVIENAVVALDASPANVLAWMGPTIGPDAFEVGAEVREAFVAVDGRAGTAFKPHAPGKYMADLYALARQRLARAGVGAVFGGGFCTYHDAERFFSYRRVRTSGRMGAFIWIG